MFHLEELDTTGQDQLAVSQERTRFYRECEKCGIGIQIIDIGAVHKFLDLFERRRSFSERILP